MNGWIFRKALEIFFLCYSSVCFTGQWPDLPVDISTPGQDASSPEVVIDSNGDVIAVWLENGRVMVRSASISGGWDPVIGTLSGAGASEPQVKIDSQGNATVIWLENGVVQSVSKVSGGSWPVSPDAISGTGASSPQMALDANGDVIVVWLEGGFVKSATKLFNGSWPGTSDTLSSSGASFPQVAVGDDGTVVAIWQEPLGLISTVYASSKQIAGSWGAAEAISSPNLNSGCPRITVDSNGKATAVWFSYQVLGSVFSDVYLQGSSLSLGGSWSVPVNISSPEIRNPADLVAQVIACPNGAALAIWTASYNGELFNLEWSLLSEEKWSSPNICVPQNLFALDFSASKDAYGDVVLAWMCLDDFSNFLLIQGALNDTSGASKIFGGTWMMSNGGSNAYPSVSVSSSSSSIIGALVWRNYNGTNNVIQAVISEVPYLLPPSNLAVTQGVNNYGVLLEYYNQITWDPSLSPNIISYLVFRDGVNIAYVDANTGSYIDRNRIQNQPVVYGVASYDNYGLQSDPASVTFP